MLQTHLETMPRFRSRNYLRPVNRIKHVIDIQGGLAAGAQVQNALATASDTPDLANVDEVQTGATVRSIYLKVEVYATSSGALSNFYMMIYKNPGGNIAGFAPNAVGSNDNKRFVIHQEMVMLQKITPSNPRTVFNGVIKIPRGYQRFAPNDVLELRFMAPGTSMDFCFQCHYKEFR